MKYLSTAIPVLAFVASVPAFYSFGASGKVSPVQHVSGNVTDLSAASIGAAILVVSSLVALSLNRPRMLEWAVIAAIIYYVGICGILHLRHPGMKPIQAPMSYYVLSSSGWLMSTTFPVFGVILLGSALLMTTLPRKSTIWVLCPAGMAFAAGGACLAGIYPVDPPTADSVEPTTVSGHLHGLAGVFVFPTITLIVFVATMYMWQRSDHKVNGPLTWLAGGVAVVMSCEITTIVVNQWIFQGLLQRLFFALFFSWVVILLYAIRQCREGVQEANLEFWAV